MINCIEESCVYNICCVECHRANDSCCCETAEELGFDREEILKKCPYAVEDSEV